MTAVSKWLPFFFNVFKRMKVRTRKYISVSHILINLKVLRNRLLLWMGKQWSLNWTMRIHKNIHRSYNNVELSFVYLQYNISATSISSCHKTHLNFVTSWLSPKSNRLSCTTQKLTLFNTLKDYFVFLGYSVTEELIWQSFISVCDVTSRVTILKILTFI